MDELEKKKKFVCKFIDLVKEINQVEWMAKLDASLLRSDTWESSPQLLALAMGCTQALEEYSKVYPDEKQIILESIASEVDGFLDNDLEIKKIVPRTIAEQATFLTNTIQKVCEPNYLHELLNDTNPLQETTILDHLKHAGKSDGAPKTPVKKIANTEPLKPADRIKPKIGGSRKDGGNRRVV